MGFKKLSDRSLFGALRIYDSVLSAGLLPIAAVTRYKDAVLAKNPIGFWRLSEAAGTQVTDISGNNRHGIYANNPILRVSSFNQDFDDKAVQLNGTTQYVTFGNIDAFKLFTGSINVWIKTANAGTGYRGIFTKNNSYGLYLNNNVLVLYDNNAGAGEKNTGINLADNISHCLSLTFQSGVTSGTKIYVDGNLVFTTTFTVFEQTFSLTLGANFNGSHVQYFAGIVDDPSIFNYVLTPIEIKEIYDAAKLA